MAPQPSVTVSLKADTAEFTRDIRAARRELDRLFVPTWCRDPLQRAAVTGLAIGGAAHAIVHVASWLS
ncbi:MAG: hypothetical protein JWP11_1297 [Frankiales bacterium]|nr:hypothetical protein [Frankiales bacterium]